MVSKIDKGANKMNPKASWTHEWLVLAVGAVCIAFTLSMSAQVQTSTTTAKGKATVDNHVESGEVVYVSGNDLVVKMSDGTIRHVANVSESARVLVDGKELGIHDLKPGMKLQRTITTTTTPKTITTVQSVTGTVWYVSPPNSVILTLADGKNQSFKIPKNQKFNVDGQMVDAWGLKKGMSISATKIVETPITVVSVNKTITGEMPPPPPPPPADVPILVVVEEEVPVPAPAQVAQAAPAELPKTGSELPLIGLLGFLALASAFGLRTVRKSR
jgi:LPXTG-motif cell wall-anchored protein